MQHLVDLFSAYTVECSFLVDQTLQHHIVSNLDGGFRGAFAVTGLEHPELAVFDGELNILQVLVMLFKAFGDVVELLVNLG